MRFQEFKSDSSCYGGRHRSATKNIYGDITSKGSKVLIGFCSICNRQKSLTVSDNTIQAGSLSDVFNNLGKSGFNPSNEMAKSVLKSPGWALAVGANVGSAFASRSPKAALSSLPEVINFFYTGEGLYLASLYNLRYLHRTRNW